MTVTASQIRRVVVMLLITSIVGCSYKTMYNQLDHLIPQYVEDMVSLDNALSQKLEHRTQVLLNWHRNTQLQQYTDWLHDIQKDVDSGLTEKKVLQRIEEAAAFWRLIAMQVNDEITLLLPMLNSEQLDELFKNLAQKNEEFREEFVEISDEQRAENYYEQLHDNYEDWLGDLSGAQEKAIKQAAKDLRSTAELRLLRRLSWQRGIRNILTEHQPAQSRMMRLRRFLAGFESADSAAMDQTIAWNKSVIARLTVNMANTMSRRQKDHFMSQTDDYIRMFRELANGR